MYFWILSFALIVILHTTHYKIEKKSSLSAWEYHLIEM